MSQATLKMRDFARRLIAHEAKGVKSSTNPPAAFRVCEKLRPYLSRLMGNAGFRALFSRALTLAGAEVVWLRGVSISKGGALEGLDEIEAKLARKDVAEGEVVLVAQLLGLLTTFIGEDLMLRLVQDAWPDLDFGKGGRK